MAITTIKTNENNDLYLVDGWNLGLSTGIEALAQSTRSYGLMRTGEDIFDILNGVDYMGTVFSSPKDLDGARASISAALVKHPDVLSVDSLVLTEEGDVLYWVANLTTVFGTVQIGNQS